MKAAKIFSIFASILSILLGYGEEPEEAYPDFEELMKMKITSVSLENETAWKTAAAVTVVTAEDIRRMGATTLPDILRRVPGVYVARISGSLWSVSCRGWEGQFSRQLLVLVDGREIYTSTYGGVVWGNYNSLVPDIEKIEVVRGPVGNIWGDNAVNGIINIITKNNSDFISQTDIVAGYGTVERGNLALSHSDILSEKLSYRLTLNGFNKERHPYENDDTHDDSRGSRAKINFNWLASEVDTLELSVEYFENTLGQQSADTNGNLFVEDFSNYGAHISGVWSRQLSKDSGLKLQAFFDRKKNFNTSQERILDTYKVDFQHYFKLGTRQHILWGGGYRNNFDRSFGGFNSYLMPKENRYFYNLFINDQISLVKKQLTMSLGCKWEYAHYTHSEFLPNIRLAYTPDDSTTVWGSISKAIHTPSKSEDNGIVVLPQPLATGGNIIFIGQDGLEPEELISYELGIRKKMSDKLTWEISLFYFDYDELVEARGDFQFPNFFQHPINASEAESYGFEAALKWMPFSWYDLDLNYSFMRFNKRLSTDISDVTLSDVIERTPRNIVNFINNFHITNSLDLSIYLRYVDNVPNQGEFDLDSYINVDASLLWKISQQLDLGIHGYNLFDKGRQESATSIYSLSNSTEVPRSVYVQLNYRF